MKSTPNHGEDSLMDPHFRIYSAPEDEIPAEDKARLDGYLRGRAEAELLKLEKADLLNEIKMKEIKDAD